MTGAVASAVAPRAPEHAAPAGGFAFDLDPAQPSGRTAASPVAARAALVGR